MKIFIIGSTKYKDKMNEYAKSLRSKGYTVMIPTLDDRQDFDELQVCEYNRYYVKQADEVHIIWDQRSVGTIFDFGMCFALRKPIRIIYIEQKTFVGVMKKYEELNDGKTI